ncbi:MAG: histidine kinase [Terrimonas sp.]|nr:histidine kinase [Terrimonas sp.]OJY93856.1 MAG: hypothetical protein BGP13_01005 [Sphingobacteriales bacterium 40-81]
MNPHFVFNSLNSIKSIIDKNENEKAVNYLTTFLKLIRTLFQNSGKREISLYEELETCRLYATLEIMRFGDKLKVVFDIDESLDLKDIKVPALILQKDNRKLLISRTLSDIEEMLPPQPFLRIHHSTLVNTMHITHFLRTDGGYIIMDNNARLSISKAKKEKVMEKLGLK